MKRNAEITVRGGQETVTARGTVEERGGVTLLAYDEPAALGMGKVHTALALYGGFAVLTRTGAVRSELRFEPGAPPHSSVYETPHGSFPAEVVTHALRAKLGAHGGLVDLRYRLTLGGVPDEHRLTILIRTEEET